MKETIADIVAELRRCPTNTVLGGIVSLICNRLADRIEAAAKREIPQPDPDWKTICEKCKDGEILPDNCEYFGEPNGCNSPLYGQHPKEGHGNSAAMREALEFAAKQLKDATEDNTFGEDIVYLVGCMRAVASVCRQTLSSPPRNCDLPLVVDGPAGNNSDKAWRVFKRHNPDAYFDVPGLLRCIDWLFAPAAEQKGGNDGGK